MVVALAGDESKQVLAEVDRLTVVVRFLRLSHPQLLEVMKSSWALLEAASQKFSSDAMMAEKLAAFGPDTMRNIEKQLLLQTIDGKWREHLLRLEHLRSVVGFRGYAQRDPLSEYKTEAFTLFESMLNGLRQDVTQKLAMIRPISARYMHDREVRRYENSSAHDH